MKLKEYNFRNNQVAHSWIEIRQSNHNPKILINTQTHTYILKTHQAGQQELSGLPCENLPTGAEKKKREKKDMNQGMVKSDQKSNRNKRTKRINNNKKKVKYKE